MTKQFLEQLKQKETGSVIVLFALSLVILLGFVSLALDVGMINMKRARMMDLCQQMRKARLDAKDYIMNADDPARLIYDISNQCAVDNNFKGHLKIYYQEQTDPLYPTTNWVECRTYRVRIEISQEYRFAFAAGLLTGSETKKITVYLDGGEQKSSRGDDGTERVPVWYPLGDLQNGSYERLDNIGAAEPHFNQGDYPTR